jgi:hypothetical protein
MAGFALTLEGIFLCIVGWVLAVTGQLIDRGGMVPSELHGQNLMDLPRLDCPESATQSMRLAAV